MPDPFLDELASRMETSTMYDEQQDTDDPIKVHYDHTEMGSQLSSPFGLQSNPDSSVSYRSDDYLLDDTNDAGPSLFEMLCCCFVGNKR